MEVVIPLLSSVLAIGLSAPMVKVRNDSSALISTLGPLCCNCHVVISNEYKDKIPAPSAEEQTQIDRIILEKHEKYLLWFSSLMRFSSRLGCQVKLTKELDGMAVFVYSRRHESSSIDASHLSQ